MALIKFSFENGMESRFQTLLRPDDIELGYRYMAKSHADDTHKLPLPPDALGVKNFQKVFNVVRAQLPSREVDGGKPIVFTCFNDRMDDSDTILVVKSVLDQISGGKSDIDVYALPELFFAINMKLAALGRCDPLPNVNIARALLRGNRLFLSAGYSCKYHEEADVHEHCALAQASAVSFLLASLLCKPMQIDMVAGKHKPKETAVSDLCSSMSEMSFDASYDYETDVINHARAENYTLTNFSLPHRPTRNRNHLSRRR